MTDNLRMNEHGWSYKPYFIITGCFNSPTTKLIDRDLIDRDLNPNSRASKLPLGQRNMAKIAKPTRT